MNTQDYFDKKTAVITGGSSGIGKAIARILVGYGASVILLGRDPEKLATVVRELKGKARDGDQIIEGIPLDVSDASKVREVVDRISKAHKTIDMLINSAGVSQSGYATQLSLDDYRRVMDINFFGTLNMIKAMLPTMLSRKSGHIVNVGLVLSLMGTFGFSTYVASKFALAGYTEVLQSELRPQGISVSLVITGYVDTPMYTTTKPLEPPETQAITAMSGVLTAEKAATKIVCGMASGKYLIYTSFDAMFYPLLNKIFPSLANFILDAQIKKAQTGLKC